MKRHSSRKSRRKDKSSSEKGGMSQYQVLGVIGEGAYGVVMKCRHKKTGEYVAMKKFKESGEADEAVRKTILREVKVLKLMRHAKPVVQLLESFRRKGRLYLVFEFVERNLLEVIEAHPDGCPMGLVDRFMYQLCGAVHECHKMRVRVFASPCASGARPRLVPSRLPLERTRVEPCTVLSVCRVCRLYRCCRALV